MGISSQENKNPEYHCIAIPPGREAHVRAVAAQAVRLARRHGWQPEAARRAGLLHDCVKGWPLPRLRRYLRRHRVYVPFAAFTFAESPGALHAYAGADWLRRRGVVTDRAILRAIAAHTLGAPRMGIPEKILFVADYVSTDRRFPGRAAIARAAMRNLDVGVGLVLQGKIAHTIARRRPVHPLSVALQKRYERLLREGRRA